MELKKLSLAAALVAALGGLYGCSEGDEATVTVNSETTTTSGGTTSGGISQTCPAFAIPKQVDVDGNEVCALPATILTDVTLTNDTVWLMQGRVTVGNGNQEMSVTEGILDSGDNVVNATLTIQAGTQVKASTGTFANLIITRGSKIDARGTAAAPIVFSSDDAGLDGTGEWGGLILHGFGNHNQCVAGSACNIDSEGESGFAGGFTADDNSGVLQFVVVTEGGFEFAPGNEINGISLVGVGSGTTMDHIQVNSNADDGLEFYGGAVNAKFLVLTGNVDDSVDWDEGYQGSLQYVIVKQTADSGGNAIEADTEGTTDFFSAPFIMNGTFIGAGSKDTLHVMKKSSGGFIFNSVMTGAAGTFANCVDVNGSGAGANVATRLVYDNIIADCTNFTTAGSDAAASNLTAGVNIQAVAANLSSLLASQAPEALLGAPVDLTAFDDVLGDVNDNLTADLDFLDATDYIGAVDPADTQGWFEGWTIDGTL